MTRADVDLWQRWNDGNHMDVDYPTSADADAALTRIIPEEGADDA